MDLALQSVIDRERRGDYLGKTVQVVPHITDAIQDWIERVASVPVSLPVLFCLLSLLGCDFSATRLALLVFSCTGPFFRSNSSAPVVSGDSVQERD